uniref:Peroxidase n=1 Tax=Romanomermis culicivorax TaxID=13658 RepID=A0A915KA53_ROMCU
MPPKFHEPVIDFHTGKLKVSQVRFVKDILPPAPFDANECRSSDSQPCFLAGSDFVNFLPTTTAFQALWLRQHNRIADELKKLNPQWEDERLYQEAKTVVSAQIQHITYNEFLPIVIVFSNEKKTYQNGQNNRDEKCDTNEI